MRIDLIGCMWIVATACVIPPKTTPFAGVLPDDVELDMSGTVSLLSDGTLHLALTHPCIMKVRSTQAANPCDREHLGSVRIVAHTPWNRDVRGTWDDPAHIAFAPDWKSTGLDPWAMPRPRRGTSPGRRGRPVSPTPR